MVYRWNNPNDDMERSRRVAQPDFANDDRDRVGGSRSADVVYLDRPASGDFGGFGGIPLDLPDRVSGTEPGHRNNDRLRAWLGVSAKALATVCVISLVSWWGWFGFHMFAAERHMAVVRMVIRENPVIAFVNNVTAYQIFPYSVEIRRQVGGAFLSMIALGQAEIEPEAAEIVWNISKSVSEWDAASMVSRAAYLLNYGRRDEIELIADRLRKVAPWSVETWIIDGYVALRLGDKGRLESGLVKAHRNNRENDPGLKALDDELRRLE